jgi:hypothetical protein
MPWLYESMCVEISDVIDSNRNVQKHHRAKAGIVERVQLPIDYEPVNNELPTIPNKI